MIRDSFRRLIMTSEHPQSAATLKMIQENVCYVDSIYFYLYSIYHI